VPFKKLDSGFPQVRSRIALYLMKKTAETCADFKKYCRVTSTSKTCQQDGKMSGLVGLIAMSKSQ
jgi:hypothetical protein